MAKYSPEETYETRESYDKSKLTPKQWFENIWYHYKWCIIIGGLILVFVVIALVQHLSNKEPDIHIMHIGPMYISPAASEQIEDSLKPFSKDGNGDGEVNINILDITVDKFKSEGSDVVYYLDKNSEGYKRFRAEISAGDSIIYFLDEHYFNECVELGILTPFEDIIDDVDMPENVISGCGVKISELDAYQLPGFDSIPEGAVLCIRRSPEKDELSYGRTQEEWDNNRKTFVNIIKYNAEND